MKYYCGVGNLFGLREWISEDLVLAVVMRWSEGWRLICYD